jgi:hypothetical protein
MSDNEPRGELARYAFGYSDQKPSWRFWAIQLAMLAFVIWTLATTPAPAAHCRFGQLWRVRLAQCVGLHSRLAAEIWRSPARPRPAVQAPPADAGDASWYVEIVLPPPPGDERAIGLGALKRALQDR